jgi:hypothetical protein
MMVNDTKKQRQRQQQQQPQQQRILLLLLLLLLLFQVLFFSQTLAFHFKIPPKHHVWGFRVWFKVLSSLHLGLF